ncbi:MAG: L7Ae/L30e/S12e/Gadd45 family ribosomal protein [Gemmatimonadales bacterium]
MNGVLRYLGLGIRAGSVVVGVDAVRRSLQAQEIRCIVVAKDASQRAREKVVRLANALGVPQVAGPNAQELGAGLGKPPVMVAGVRDPTLAEGIVRAGEAGLSNGGVSG